MLNIEQLCELARRLRVVDAEIDVLGQRATLDRQPGVGWEALSDERTSIRRKLVSDSRLPTTV